MVLSSVSKNWLLGWYNDKAIAIDRGESWRGRLVAFVDYELAGPNNNEVVLLRLGDFLFVQYNKKVINTGTSLHRLAVIGRGGLTSSSSVLHADLGPRESSWWKDNDPSLCLGVRCFLWSGLRRGFGSSERKHLGVHLCTDLVAIL